MSWIKWLSCWWHRQHIACNFYRGDGRLVRKCVRCGVDL